MLVNFYKKIIDKALIMKISSLSTFPLPPVVVFRAKSVCGQYKKVTINGFFLRIVIFCYIMWRDIIQDNIVLHRDSSLRDRVDFLVSQTDATSYFVRKILVEKPTLSAT